LKKGKAVLLGAGLALSLILALPWLIPLDRYIAEAEQAASAALGIPVRIGDLRIAMLPSPRLKIDQVNIGKKTLLSAEQIVVVPALASVFSGIKTISSIKIIEPVIKQDAFDLVSSLSAGKQSTGPAPVNVRRIVIEEAMLDMAGMQLPAMNAELTLGEGNALELATLESADGKLKAVLKPEKDYQSLMVTANAWTVPVGPPLLINELQANMALHGDRLDIKRLTARLYKGRISGSARLRWGKKWQVDGRLKVAGLSVKEPVSLMSKATRVSGSLFGDGKFSTSARQPKELAERMRADFSFKVEDGVIYGVDLARAATLLLRQGQKGGETHFDELSGLLKVVGQHYQFRDLKITSGLIAAAGVVKMNPEKALDGVVDVEVRRSLSLAAIPLQISGTVDDPVVRPTKAAMAGAVAGTAVLGPGIGTTLGIRAGSAITKLKGLFGGDEEE
jgi:uncharacterized protein involved in outer membrane biogenesis